MTTSTTTAANAGSYDDNAGAYTYYGKPTYWGDPYPYGEPYKPRPAYPWQESLSAATVVKVPAQDPQNDRKEKTEMIDRQTFLDALADEGKTITPEQRDLIRDAENDKWRLFVARLLARLVKSADFETLKEKPKEVLVTTKEA